MSPVGRRSRPSRLHPALSRGLVQCCQSAVLYHCYEIDTTISWQHGQVGPQSQVGTARLFKESASSDPACKRRVRDGFGFTPPNTDRNRQAAQDRYPPNVTGL